MNKELAKRIVDLAFAHNRPPFCYRKREHNGYTCYYMHGDDYSITIRLDLRERTREEEEEQRKVFQMTEEMFEDWRKAEEEGR